MAIAGENKSESNRFLQVRYDDELIFTVFRLTKGCLKAQEWQDKCSRQVTMYV